MSLPALASVTRLHLVLRIHRDTDAGRLRELFPNLRQLLLRLESAGPVTVDLSALTWVPQVDVTITGGAVRLTGYELLSIRHLSPPE